MSKWQIYIEHLELDQKAYWIECDDVRVMQLDEKEYVVLKRLFEQYDDSQAENERLKKGQDEDIDIIEGYIARVGQLEAEIGRQKQRL